LALVLLPSRRAMQKHPAHNQRWDHPAVTSGAQGKIAAEPHATPFQPEWGVRGNISRSMTSSTARQIGALPAILMRRLDAFVRRLNLLRACRKSIAALLRPGITRPMNTGAATAGHAGKPGPTDIRKGLGGVCARTSFDALGRYDEAFTCFTHANILYREQRASCGERFDAAQLRAQVDDPIAIDKSMLFSAVAGWGSPSETPVFVVGMPRSGHEPRRADRSQSSACFWLRRAARRMYDLQHIGGAKSQHTH
jgi:hypothetical protein